MDLNLTFHLDALQSNLTRLQAGHFDWRHSEITALEKRAGRAGNQRGGDLDVRLTN